LNPICHCLSSVHSGFSCFLITKGLSTPHQKICRVIGEIENSDRRGF
jgi:hypothetical protein